MHCCCLACDVSRLRAGCWAAAWCAPLQASCPHESLGQAGAGLLQVPCAPCVADPCVLPPRSADCVADGDVRVVVLRKRDFLDLDNPLLAWMMDYDAVAAVLKALPHFQKLKQEQMEQVLDR